MARQAWKAARYVLVFFATALAVLLVHLFSQGPEAAILMYHSVGIERAVHTSLNVPSEVFARQMDFLSRHQYRVIRLTELAEKIRRGERIPRKTVVLTFDDGYENNYINVFPVLKKYGFPATVFLIASKLGKNHDLVENLTLRIMTGGMAREMSDSGLVDFGSHTLRHSYLPGIADKGRLGEEIVGSKKFLEGVFGKPVETFSYPIGGYSRGIEQMVRAAGYKAAVTINKKNASSRDLYALKRIKVKSFHPVSFFVQTSGYYLRLKEI
ncbi:MAG: polysaccharide deacetylase family protein [Candidatus Omnitrophota bacterium]